MLISDYYLSMNKALHKDKGHYGAGGGGWIDVVSELMRKHPGTVLDYGCGKSKLSEEIRKIHSIVIAEYDPAIEGKDGSPSEADIVVCTDVLEHIEPECLEAVLKDIHRVTRRIAFLAISLRDAKKVLPDGRNAHLIVRPQSWWEARLNEAGFLIKQTYPKLKPDTVCYLVRRFNEHTDNRDRV